MSAATVNTTRELNKTDVNHIFTQYVNDNGIKASADEIAMVVELAFKHLDTDNSTTISGKEIAHGAIKLADKNDDGKMNLREILCLVRQYAKFRKVKLRRGW